jgi:ferritin-like metal-binding protein YciE
MKIETMDDLFLNELKDIYDCEKKLVKALPKMAKAVTSMELREAIQSHLEETKGHVQRLEEIFQHLGEKASTSKCEGIEGIISEGEEMIDAIDQSPLLDAAIIAAAQKAEHYEISAYGSCRTFAQELGRNVAVQLLEQTLEEEKQADEKLTQIAESRVNEDAIRTGSGGGAL